MVKKCCSLLLQSIKLFFFFKKGLHTIVTSYNTIYERHGRPYRQHIFHSPKISRIDLDACLWIHFIFNNFPWRARNHPTVFIMNKWRPFKSRPANIFTHHTVKIGDDAIFVGIRIEEHLSVGMDGYVSPHVFLVLAQELGDGLHFGLGLGERATVGVVTRVCGGAFFCR